MPGGKEEDRRGMSILQDKSFLRKVKNVLNGSTAEERRANRLSGATAFTGEAGSFLDINILILGRLIQVLTSISALMKYNDISWQKKLIYGLQSSLTLTQALMLIYFYYGDHKCSILDNMDALCKTYYLMKIVCYVMLGGTWGSSELIKRNSEDGSSGTSDLDRLQNFSSQIRSVVPFNTPNSQPISSSVQSFPPLDRRVSMSEYPMAVSVEMDEIDEGAQTIDLSKTYTEPPSPQIMERRSSSLCSLVSNLDFSMDDPGQSVENVSFGETPEQTYSFFRPQVKILRVQRSHGLT